MRLVALLIGLCTALTAVLAVPAPSKIGCNAELTCNGNAVEILIKKHLSANNLSKTERGDYFSDLICCVLRMTVKELLGTVETTFIAFNNITRDGITKLEEAIANANPEVRQQLLAITENATNQTLGTVRPFLESLGIVLPVISSNDQAAHDLASDIIWALLGIELKDLVIAIAVAMDSLLTVIGNAMDGIKELAPQAGEEVGEYLNTIADTYLGQGRLILIPILDKLLQLVDTGAKAF